MRLASGRCSRLAACAGLWIVSTISSGAALAADAPPARATSDVVLPFVERSSQVAFETYLDAKAPKAVALSPSGASGFAWGQPSEDVARRVALERCQKNATLPCQLFAVGDRVVWTGPYGTDAQGEWSQAAVRGAQLAGAPFADEDHDWGIAPQSVLHVQAMHAPTPRQLPRGRTVTTAELVALMNGPASLTIIDVLHRRGRIASVIPSARWIDGAGGGQNKGENWVAQDSASLPARRFRETMQRIAPDKAAALVFYCLSVECWFSYNAALRATALGYTNVIWYRGGLTSWRAAGLPVVQHALDAEILIAEPEDAAALAPKFPETPAAADARVTKPVAWRALVVAGDDKDKVFDTAVDRYVRKLKEMGLSDGAIRTLSPTAKADDRKPSETNFDSALHELAVGPGQGCLVIVTSHGTTQGVRMKTPDGYAYLSPAAVQRSLDRHCGGSPTVLIVSACHSGVFVSPALQSNNRIVLTAARADRVSFGCSTDFDVPIYDKCVQSRLGRDRLWLDLARNVAVCIRNLEYEERERPPSLPQHAFGQDMLSMALPAAQ